MQFAELQAALLAAGYREERLPRRAGQRVFDAGQTAATARQRWCGSCGYHGLWVYPFYRPSPFAVVLVVACPTCGCVQDDPQPEPPATP